MKTKLEMAHEYAMQHLKNSGGKITMHSLCLFAWQYADAMQAEADNRKDKKQSEHVFEAVDDWQPDWSQAPSDALTWAINGKGDATWALYENGEFYSCVKAPSFNYKGDWRDSLRKRPQ